MSTNKTPNYNLHSWVGTDYVKREEFNENFSTIDTTLKAANDAINTKAASTHTHTDATTGASGFMSAADKVKLNGVATGAEVNQNTFANVKVGATTIAADTKTDTLEIVAGTNVVLTPDDTLDRVTIGLSGSVETTTGSQAKATAAETAANTYTDGKVAAIVFPVTSVAGKTGAVTLAAGDVGAAPSSHVGTGGAAHADATTSVAGFMTAADKVKLNGIAAGAQTNQNAFSNIRVGATTVAADNATDTFEMVAGTNVVLTPDTTNDRVTIALSSAVETTAGAQSKADAAESRAKAASLPSTAARISTVDLNTFVTSGEFALGSSLTNAPAGFSFGTLFVSNSSSDRITQTAYAPGQGKTFIRYGTGTTVVWSPWVENETVDGSQAKVDTHAADAIKHITSAERSTWNGKASTAVATTSANGLMASTDKTKLDGIATGANNYTHPSTHPATMITEDSSRRFATDAEKSAWNAKASTAVATTSANGLMASTDKSKLDGIAVGATRVESDSFNGSIKVNGSSVGVYTHPATHSPSIIVQDASNRFVTDTEKSNWNAKASTAIATTGSNGLMSSVDKTKLEEMYENTVFMNITLQNGWTNYASYTNAQAAFIGKGMVMLRGWIIGGASGTVAFTLPAGMRPNKTWITITGGFQTAANIFRISVGSGGDGTITQISGTNIGLVSLDGIVFTTVT